MVVTRVVVKNATYRDSISLMKLSTGISKLPGVTQAAVVMATELNRRVLYEAGFKDQAIDRAGGDDMIVAIEASDQSSLDAAFAETERELASSSERAGAAETSPRSLNEALQLMPGANLALISVPGQFADLEATAALKNGLNVFLFSSNVSREAEVQLKRLASDRGLLVMGPDCGTAIINHKVLGFGNVIRPGEIGLVSASGTGLQEVTTLIHKAGLGITQAIGTGGGDISEQVGGITMAQGIRLLETDEKTKLIVLISKPPNPKTMLSVLQEVNQCTKPVVVNFLGADLGSELLAGVTATRTLEEAAGAACRLLNPNLGGPAAQSPDVIRLALAEHGRLSPTQKFVRGLFSGGTLCYESQVILTPLLGTVYSNGPIRPENKVPGEAVSKGNSCIDMGAEEFVEGRAHPMIDFSLRKLRILQEAQDPQVAVLLLDLELGYGSNPDPADELAPTIQRAKAIASMAGRHLPVVASIVGTDEDPQGLSSQEEALKKSGVILLPTNAQATSVAAAIALGKDTTSASRGLESRGRPPSASIIGQDKVPGLIGAELRVVNIGISTFAEDLRAQDVQVVHVDWKPPAGGDVDMLKILERLGS